MSNHSNNSQSTMRRQSRPAGRGSRSHATDIGTVRDDIRTISRDVAHLGSDAAALTSNAAEAAVQTVRDSAETALASAKEIHGQACKWVSQRPTISVLIAVGVGALAARLMSRR